jgi:hypothetical protein
MTSKSRCYSGIFIRALSLAIDFTIIVLPIKLCSILYILITLIYDLPYVLKFLFEKNAYMMTLQLIFFIYMFSCLISKNRKTLGMKINCIYLESATPRKMLSFFQILSRTLLFNVAIIPISWSSVDNNIYTIKNYIAFGVIISIIISIIISYLRTDKAGIHDLLCNTRVLRRRQHDSEPNKSNYQYNTHYFSVLVLFIIWSCIMPLVKSGLAALAPFAIISIFIVCISLTLVYLKKYYPNTHLKYSWKTAFQENKALIRYIIPSILLYVILYSLTIWVLFYSNYYSDYV